MTIRCTECGTEVEAQRSTRKFCDPCRRKRDHRRDYRPVNKVRTCSECGTEWESARGTGKYCPACRKERADRQRRDWEATHRDERAAYSRERRYALKHSLKKYGLTLEEFDEMVRVRGGKCDICPRRPKSLCVDHCHETGIVRGLLCSPCNRAIGQLGDTAEHLRRALAYLQRAEALR